MPSREVVETVSEQQLKSGHSALLMFPFHANPEPTNLTWYINDLKYPLELHQTSGRYTSQGWIRYVSGIS